VPVIFPVDKWQIMAESRGMQYVISSKPGMTPWAHADTLSAAIAESVRAIRAGLDGRIIPDGDATPLDCDEAAQLLGWDRDPDSVYIDRPVSPNDVARKMANWRPQ
jgi:hypothetical protein